MKKKWFLYALSALICTALILPPLVVSAAVTGGYKSPTSSSSVKPSSSGTSGYKSPSSSSNTSGYKSPSSSPAGSSYTTPSGGTVTSGGGNTSGYKSPTSPSPAPSNNTTNYGSRDYYNRGSLSDSYSSGGISGVGSFVGGMFLGSLLSTPRSTTVIQGAAPGSAMYTAPSFFDWIIWLFNWVVFLSIVAGLGYVIYRWYKCRYNKW